MIKLHILLDTLLVAIIAFLLFGSNANADDSSILHDCDKNPIYCQIIDNVPTIKRTYAFELSNVIFKICTKYDLNPKLLTSIFAQESKFDISRKNCTTGLVESTTIPNTYSKTVVCTDFGIGQIWHGTADSYDFDITKLTTDMEYSVEAAAIVLKDFKNMYHKKEKFWWTRYNASSPSKRLVYRGLVQGYMDAN